MACEAETKFQAGSELESKKGRGSGGGGESEDGGSQYGHSGGKVEESCSKA